MNRLATKCLILVALACTAGVANAVQWKYPPGPPYRSCPDSLSIFQIQNPDTFLAMCHPALLDTVQGVRGIITGFDKDFSPYAFWIQNSQGGAWTGVQVFTGATSYFVQVGPGGNLAVGDSVTVTGTTQNVNGSDTSVPDEVGFNEIEGPDRTQSSNDIIISKISSGNPLPPFHRDNATNLKWVPTALPAGNLAKWKQEQWEGCLVRIVASGPGSLKVGRTAGVGVGSRSFLLADPALPGDSVAVDGFNLTNIGAPPVGTPVDSAQGIFHDNSISGVRSYRILMRGVSDLFACAPPNLVDSYHVADNVIRCVFDRNLDPATGTDPTHYDLSNLDAVLSVSLEGGSGPVALLTIDNTHTTGELPGNTVKAHDIKALCGASDLSAAMPTAQTRTFVTGVMKVADIQTADPAFLPHMGYTDCFDRSRYAGTGATAGIRVSWTGICTAHFGTIYSFEDPLQPNDTGQRSGVELFGAAVNFTVGHKYLIAGQVQEFGGPTSDAGETEPVNTVYALDQGNPGVPNPRVQTVAVLSDLQCDPDGTHTELEDYEGVLVKVVKATVVAHTNNSPDFYIKDTYGDPADSIEVFNSQNSFSFRPDIGHVVTVTGIAQPFTDQTSSTTKGTVKPRSNADVIDHGVGQVGVDEGVPAKVTFALFPNPSPKSLVRFGLPRAAQVDLSVYDLAGRHLATLARGLFAPGTFTRQWSGRDGSGKEAGSGVFFYKLRVNGEIRVLRSVRIN